MSAKEVAGADEGLSIELRVVTQNGSGTPEQRADSRKVRQAISIWDKFTLGHYTGVIFKGFRSLINERDLVTLEEHLASKHCSEVFERKWLKEQKMRARKRGFEAVATDDFPSRTPYTATTAVASPNSIWGALIRSFWPVLIRCIFIEMILTASRLLQPVIMGELIEFMGSDQADIYAYGLCACLFLSNILISLSLQHLLFQNILGGIQARSALMTALYQKSLLLAPDSSRSYSLGEQMNLMSIDVDNAFDFVQRWHLLWVWILRLITVMGLLWVQLGPSCFAGFLVMCATMPVSAVIGNRIATFQAKHMEEKGRRLSLLTEILNGIKMIKLYAWENAFGQRIGKIRAQEVSYARFYLLYETLLSLIWTSTPFVISAVAFGCFVLIDSNNVLTAKRVFVSLTLFNSLRFSLTFLPSILAAFTRCRVSLRRIQEFLQAEELDVDEVTHDVGEGEAIVLENASFAWNSSVTLSDLNIRIAEGELVAVVGTVGAGKSSLLSAILGSMNKLTGRVHRKQVPIAYVPQQAWIQNDSVRKNIVFTAPYDSTWFNEVVDRCCLLPDFRMLHEGDLTEIGEKGVNLSGGQKQRISVARAVYQKAELYLLDDPLSSVDVHVSQDLFEGVIGPNGLLKNATRILVTHSQAVLPFVDRIVLVREGRIDFVGSYEEFARIDAPLRAVIDQKEEDVAVEDAEDQSPGQRPLPEENGFSAKKNDNWKDAGRRTEEAMAVGTVPWSLYWAFTKRFGLLYVALVMFGFSIHEMGKIAGIFWLREWTEDAHRPIEPIDGGNGTSSVNDSLALAGRVRLFESTDDRTMRRINGFLGLGVVEMVGVLFGCLSLALGCLRASTSLHDDVMKSILRAPLQFFDTTPVGQVVNRLSKDIDVLDLELYVRADGWLACAGALIGALVVVLVKVPILMAVLIPCGIILTLLLRVYMRNARQIQRLASAKRSPVLNHFSETVSGASSIRAFNVERNFTEEFVNRLDVSQNCILHSNASSAWVSMRVDLLASLVILSMALIVVYQRDIFTQGMAGLLLTYSIMSLDGLNWMFRMSSQLESTVIAAERLDDYTKIPSERPWNVSGVVDPLWPLEGSLSINDYSTAYREDRREVLQNLKLDIPAGAKVGVVGRTGAGKSSLSLALFRALEATKGSIKVDGVDITSVGLHDLRTRLTIIPQDPVLFRGNLRTNLDPQDAHSDEEVLSALERAHLNKSVFPLNMDIADGGSNLSVGERQLLCLARALLRRSKILVLDEATAAVDRDTDLRIQQTIREDFAASTVITIAHRLNTVLDYDMIVVLSAGQIVEVGNPKDLLQSRNSVFYSMAKDAAL